MPERDELARRVSISPRCIRAGAGHHRPKPRVFAGEELAVHVIRMSARGDRGAGVVEHLPQHDVMRRLANEQAANACVAEYRVAVRQRIATRCDGVRGTGLVQPPLRLTDRKHLAVCCEISTKRPGDEFRVFLEVAHRQPVVPAGGGVIIAEPVAEVVPPLAALRGAGFQAKLAGQRMKPEVVAAERDSRARLHADHVAAAVSVGAVQPAVEAPAEAVHKVLRVACLESGEPGLTDVTAAIAVVVAGVEDVGHAGNEHAPLPAGQSGDVLKAIEKERALLVASVAIGVLEDPHAAGLEPLAGAFPWHAILPGHLAVGRRLALRERVVAHLRHPHPAAFIPVDEHRIHHLRFGRHQRRRESVGQPHRAE